MESVCQSLSVCLRTLLRLPVSLSYTSSCGLWLCGWVTRSTFSN